MNHPRNTIKSSKLLLVKNTAFVTILWIALMYMYFYFCWWSIKDFLKPNLFNGYIHSPVIHVEIIVQGIVFGVLFAMVNNIIDKTIIRKKSFGAIILIKSTFYLLAIIISMMVVYAIYFVFNIIPMEQIIEMQSHLPWNFIVSLLIYFTFATLFVNFLSQINRKFGQGILFHMFIGTYTKPRNERKIFMFLDLNNSTGLAEKLGHYNYSRFIQTCIQDLTQIIIKHKAQVYQYVGDEIVLTWPVKSGFKNNNCIKLFYAYQEQLKANEKYYVSNFNCTPTFKAGLDEGIITVTEVGDIKREIAYHGDVLNTASRLEKLCNKLNKKILISDRLFKHLPPSDFFQKEFAGEHQLRGKGSKEKVYGIERVF